MKEVKYNLSVDRGTVVIKLASDQGQIPNDLSECKVEFCVDNTAIMTYQNKTVQRVIQNFLEEKKIANIKFTLLTQSDEELDDNDFIWRSRMTDAFIYALVELINKGKLQSLKSLDLSECQVGNYCLKELTKVATSCRNITELRLANFQSITTEFLLKFVRKISKHSEFEVLELSNVLLYAGSDDRQTFFKYMATLLENNKKLRHLNLSGNMIDDEHLKVLASALKSSPELQLEVLDLSNNNIGNEGLEALLSVLETGNPKLKVLNLSNNNILYYHDSDYRLLIKPLERLCFILRQMNNPCEELNLSGNYINNRFLRRFNEFFIRYPEKLPKKLNFSFPKFAIDKNELVSLGYGVKELAETLKTATTTSIDLRGYDIKADALSALQVAKEVRKSAKTQAQIEHIGISFGPYEDEETCIEGELEDFFDGSLLMLAIQKEAFTAASKIAEKMSEVTLKDEKNIRKATIKEPEAFLKTLLKSPNVDSVKKFLVTNKKKLGQGIVDLKKLLIGGKSNCEEIYNHINSNIEQAINDVNSCLSEFQTLVEKALKQQEIKLVFDIDKEAIGQEVRELIVDSKAVITPKKLFDKLLSKIKTETIGISKLGENSGVLESNLKESFSEHLEGDAFKQDSNIAKASKLCKGLNKNRGAAR